MYTLGERDDRRDDRYAQWDDGNLGSFWTKIRDKVIKPVGRVVAAYYTGGSSEIAFKAYDAKEAQKKAIAAQKKQMKQLEAMGNAYPPYPVDPMAQQLQQLQQQQQQQQQQQRTQAYGMPAQQQPMPYGYPQQPGVYVAPQLPYNQPQGVPSVNVQPSPVGVSHAKLPDWALPAGIGAAVLLVLVSQRR